jgi:hypothetical protein
MKEVGQMLTRNAWFSKAIPVSAGRLRVPDALVYYIFLVAVCAVSMVGGCSFTEVESEEVTPEPVVLVDQTGKEWDVTTAVWKYGFEIERFEFGLGPNAIEPLIEPDMLSPGDRGYPADNGTFLVIGAAISGDIRAYAKFDIIQNEVVDEYIGGVPVAVAY